MTDHLEEPSGAEKAITPLERANFGAKLLESLLTEYTQVLKVQFGLQTGSLVLLLKVLTDTSAPFVVRTALAISVLLFGASAIICLNLLGGVVEVRARTLDAWADNRENWADAFKARMNEWANKTKRIGKRMDWLFRFAIIFASLFVVGVLVTNPQKPPEAQQSATQPSGTQPR